MGHASLQFETISRPAHRADNVRLAFASNGLAQTPHMDVYCLRLHGAICAPDPIKYLLTREDAIWEVHQHLKQAKFGWAEMDIPAVARHSNGGQVYRQLAYLQADPLGLRASSTKKGPHPGKQLRDAERPHQVIIRTGLKGAHYLPISGAAGHNHTDFSGLREGAELAAQLDAAQGRQTPVQQYHVRSKLRASVQCVLTIQNALDGEAIPFQVPPQGVGGRGSSFDQ
jgi:hypothetical protein